MRTLACRFTFCIAAAAASMAVPAQQQPVQQPQREKKAPVVQTPAERLVSAKNVLVIRTRGGDIPYDTIRMTVEGWGRFTLVNVPEKADLIIEVASFGGDSETHLTSGMNPSLQAGLEPFSSSGKELPATEVRMTVADARSKRVLWHGTESARAAMRRKAWENNLVQAAEKLASRFHDRLEPPPAR